MFLVFPVYPFSLCVSKSTHEGALPGPAYPYFKNNRSTDVHTVMWLPGPWVKKTGSVFGDANVLMLAGHDTGMMIPHVSPIMDNLLLPLTLVTSGCAWPFTSIKSKSEGKGLVGFFPGYAPYIFCDAEKAGGESSAATQKGRPHTPAPKVEPKKKGKLETLADKAGFEFNVSGRGRVYIPGCKTIMMRMSLAELLYGWAKFLMSKVFDSIAGAALSHVKIGNKQLARLDSDVARRRALQEFSGHQARVLSAAARADVVNHIALEIGRKSAYDGVLKSLILDGKVKAPYGLFSYSWSKHEGTFLWWGELDGFEACPIEFKGVRGSTTEAFDGVALPYLEELLADNPNHATALLTES